MIRVNIDPKTITDINETAGLLDGYPKAADMAIARAIKSAGFFLSTEMKAAVDKGGPDSGRWEKLNPYTAIISKANRRITGRSKGSLRSRQATRSQAESTTPENPLRRFKGGLRYSFSKEDIMASIGFVNPKWAERFRRLAGLHASGYTTTVSRQMQKKMFALGFFISTKRLVTPARPLVVPVFEEEKTAMLDRISHKFMSSIASHFAGKGQGR